MYITTRFHSELKKQQPTAEKTSFLVSIVFIQIWLNDYAVQAKSKHNDMVTSVSAVPRGDLVPTVAEKFLEKLRGGKKLTTRHLTKYRPATFSNISHPPHCHLLDRPSNYENRNDQQPIPRQTDCSHTAPQCPEH